MRLFLRIYLSIVGIVVLMVATVGCLGVMFRDDDRGRELAALVELWVQDLPEEPVERDRRLRRLGHLVDHEVALRDRQGRLLAGDGEVPAGPPGPYRDRGGHGYRMQLDDGRSLAVFARPNPRRHLRFLVLLGVLGAVIAAGAWPLARGLSRRLERLRDQADRWGAGELGARVAVEGHDEVAQLGRAFNQAADRVEGLVQAQQRALAEASHELRSPLARLRMALEMAEPGPMIDQAVAEVEQLDGIIGDVLRSARMDALAGPEDPQPVDLRALLEAEAGDDVEVRGPSRVVQGDRRLLERLVHNLVANARQHGVPPIVLTVTATGFTVDDRGAALSAEEGEALFAPFARRAGHAEGVHGGVGLGLALVRRIARFHGGEARYGAHEGRTRFEVELG